MKYLHSILIIASALLLVPVVLKTETSVLPQEETKDACDKRMAIIIVIPLNIFGYNK